MKLYLSADAVEKSRKLHGKMEFQGLPISVENRAGSARHWHDPHSGEDGSTKMKYPYGYIRGTLGTDGDEVDVFVGPNEDSTKVFVVTQMKKPGFKEVDEQKVMLGFHSASEAKRAYLDHYDDPKFFGSMKEFPMTDFKEKLTSYKGKLIKHLFLADPSAKLEKAVATYADLENAGMEKAHIGFEKLQGKIEGQGHSAASAAKIAAAVGNKKYGEKKMHHAAAEGKPLKEGQKMDKSCEHNVDGETCEKCNGTHSTTDILKALNSRLLSMIKRSADKIAAAVADPIVQSGEVTLFGPQVAQAAFVDRPFESPVTASVEIPTVQSAATPLAPDFMTSCGGCGYVHKSLGTCPRCAQVAALNARVAIPAWRR